MVHTDHGKGDQEVIAMEKLEARLLEDEGEILHAYPDSEGFLTIGVGHLIDSRKNGKISQAASRFILAEDIREKTAIAASYPWFESLDWPRQGVVTCMLFQLGKAGFDSFKMFHLALSRGDYAMASSQMLSSLWHSQTPARCERLAKIMLTGEWI